MYGDRSRLLRRVAKLTALTTLAGVAVTGADLALAGIAGKGRAPSVITGSGLADFDKRLDGVRVAPSKVQQAALRALGDVEVGWTALGTPHSLRARKGALSAPSNAAPDAVARGFLRQHAALFRQQPADIARLRLTMLDPDKSGATFLRYQQTHGPRAVHGATLLVTLDHARRVLFVGGTLAPSLGAVAPPVLSADAALARVAGSVKVKSARGDVRPLTSAIGAASAVGTKKFHNTLSNPARRNAQPITAELVTVPTATGGRTAWQIRADVASNADYVTLVDATTGEVLYRKNQWSNSEPHGLVHTGDDPEAGGQVAGVVFSGIDGSWVDDDTTSGNNTNTYQDLDDDDDVTPGSQPVNADQHFDYPWTDPWGSTGVLPTTGDERDATVTQLFYYTNWWHDYAYGLGFTETARNFQNDNFGRGGTGGDAVRAESDDGYGTGVEKLCQNSANVDILCRNNANFNANGPDGTVPRMQMFVGDDGGRRTQRANNRDTVIHEYMHGISGRIISDGNLAGDVQSGALGEGWGDAMATSVNNDPVYGEYNNGDYTNGIRGVSYADNNQDHEYGDICNNDDPDDPDDPPCQVHDDGRIWAMTMWEVRDALIGKHGFNTGKALHEDYLMLGMKNTPDTPSFHDARTGYLTADALTTILDPNDTNQCLLWRVFAENELGVTDSPDADNDMTPTVSTDTPDECDPVATITGILTRPEGTDVALDGSTSTVGGDPGDDLSYAWDLDDDGDYDDSTAPNPTFTDVGTDGSFPISLRVTNTAGYSDTTDATITITNVTPSFSSLGADGPKGEGALLTVSGLVTDPGWEDDLSVTIDWNDGSPVENVAGAEENSRPDATLGFSVGHYFGDNGSYAVNVCKADDDTNTCTVVPVTITNVAPTVTIDPSQLTNRVENQALPVSATFSDPGWLDTYPTATVDDGTGGGAQPGIATVTNEGGPGVPDTGTITGTALYGDNGIWTVTVSLTDDDGGEGQASFDVTVHNVDPNVVINETGAVIVNGVPTLFADVGVPVQFRAQITDPGSDDLTTTWDWDDGAPSPDESNLSLVNPPLPDPPQSPSVQPRDISHDTSHAFGLACMYDVVAGATDDDSGTASDSIKVLITGSPTFSRGAGYWQTAYKHKGGAGFSDEQLQCYLDIATFLSNTFNEARDASTIPVAYDDIFVAGKKGSMQQQLDRELLAAWINFANGGVEYTELLDTNGDLIPDTSFIDVMTAAESVRLNPASTRAQQEAKKNLLEKINGRDGL